MTATNHALTGAVIGLSISNPIIALPLALGSHYIMDALPHFGKKWEIHSTKFTRMLMLEALFCFLIVLIIFVVQPKNVILGIICAFVAAAPDLLSFNSYLKARQGKEHKPSLYFKFAKRIQKKEAPENYIYDLIWFIVFLVVLTKTIAK